MVFLSGCYVRPAMRNVVSAKRGLTTITVTLCWWTTSHASFTDMDPNRFTCLLPIGEEESLADSTIWQIMLSSAQTGLDTDAQFTSGSLQPHIREEVDSEIRSRVHLPDQRQVRDPKFVLKLVDKKIAQECAQGIEVQSPVYAAQAMFHSTASGRVLKSAEESVGPTPALLNVGIPCWQNCSEKSGECTTGFCGRGVCCKRWELHPDCPLGFHGGCENKHCCVDRPADTTQFVLENKFCNASAGLFCLSSLLPGHRDMFSAVQLCALQRTLGSCPPGFWCPGGAESPRACPRGVRCPTGSRERQPCPAGFFCPISITQRRCPTGFLCDENTTLPGLCPEGHYCPQGIRVVCPAGHFCAPGAPEPWPCSRLASCPEGSSFQRWGHVAGPSLAVIVAAWSLAIKSVPHWLNPRPSVKGALPAVTLVLGLALAWAARLELLSEAARLLGADSAQLRTQRLVGGAPHISALLFMTLTYMVLVYGHWTSTCKANRFMQQIVDPGVCIGTCLAFAAFLNGRIAVLILLHIAFAFHVVWLLLLKQGAWELRVSLLAAGLLALAVGFCYLGAPLLAQLLGLALMVAPAKELAHVVFPLLQRVVRRRRLAVAESALTDTPIRPLISSLLIDSVDADSSASDMVTAACVAAGARASLAENSLSGEPAKGRMPFPNAMDIGLWLPWTSHVQYQQRGSRDMVEDSAGVAFELRAVSYCIENKRKLLHDLSFIVPAGASVAIMGASGSGKTTLLSVLSGRCGDGRFLGELRLNGVVKLPWQMAEIRPLIGYVPQDDVMHTCLTVTENIEFQAELRLPRRKRGCTSATSMSHAEAQEIKDRIEAVVQGLGLTHVRDRIISDGLSGGQRKRVSIGMEVVSKPRVLLLDEPSTGLDASTSHRIMEMVVSTADAERCTTFATIHQPRWPTLTLFKMLVLLAPGGHLCYAGPVAAVKAYFTEVLHLEFPEDENPADIIIDACTFESARRMAVEGEWKCPPQCLRAVLFPTPEAVQEEKYAFWQQEEFGKMLAAVWDDFAQVCMQNSVGMLPLEENNSLAQARNQGEVAACPSMWEDTAHRYSSSGLQSPPTLGYNRGGGEAYSTGEPELYDSLLVEAKGRMEAVHWGQQVWIHVARASLVLSRELWPTVALHMLLLWITMVALAWAFPGGNLEHVFLQNGLMLMLLCLTQSIGAQRLFGGAERHVALREASVTSLSQVLYGFIGKDVVGLVEMFLAAMVYTLTYWPLATTYASVTDFFAIGFATLYCIWGMNHIFAIAFPGNTAMLLAVTTSFLSFMFSGLRPEAHVISASLGGYGSLLLLASPVRWAMSHWIFRHVTGPGSTYAQGSVKDKVEPVFSQRGFSMNHLACPDYSAVVAVRWANKSGWVCHSGQLFLLGFLFRFLAATCLLLRSSAGASGGQLSFGASTITKARMLRHCMIVFLIFVTVFDIFLLGRTY